MEIKLAGREMPRDAGGDVKFTWIGTLPPQDFAEHEYHPDQGVFEVFTQQEVVELVNRAIYQLEYQAASHRKRGQAERARMKLLKEQLGKAAAKDATVKEQLKGGGDK
jgi:hypothetical protein